jgi:endoglucanase
MDKRSLQIGINLGSWISQYPVYSHRHFKTFITVHDIKRIADWGVDHIRLPLDYPVLEDDRRPGVYKESGFEYVESCLNWCEENGLRLILDLHKAPGYSFDGLDESSLFGSPALQDRFLDLWQAMAKRFADRMDDTLAFEMLNEVVLPESGPWNLLIKRVVARIRLNDPRRLIIIGGNHYNAPDELRNLEVLDDPNILYTFHFYAPLTVTHQKAPWIPALVQYNQRVDYPGQAIGLEAFLKANPEHRIRLGTEVGRQFDVRHLESVLQPALEFAQRFGQPVYCGELGVYERAPMATRLNWTRDVIALLSEHGIGYAIWTYKNLDFGLVDKDGQVVSQELIEIASHR